MTTPNKEIIRRICRLYGATDCYLCKANSDGNIDILTNIPNEKLESCEKELESWAGMTFKVSNLNSPSEKLDRLIRLGEKILPIKF